MNRRKAQNIIMILGCRFIPFSGKSFVSSYDMEPSALLFPFSSCFMVVCFMSFSLLIHLSKIDGNAASLPDGSKQENSLPVSSIDC